jgi:peptide chain release factor 1
VTVAVKAKGTSEPGEAPYALLKFEGGVHRVQRVPVTESQGRVHTSAAGVLVMPEAEQVDVTIEEKDIRIDVFRSSGPGGQSVNTTDSAVRITHLPTGIVASCQNEKSQLQNREQAMRILRARLLQAAQDTAAAEASHARRSQVRTVDRSERIRTYNVPENRISDHRTGYKSYNLDQVLDGDLEAVVASAVDAELAARLDALEPGS